MSKKNITLNSIVAIPLSFIIGWYGSVYYSAKYQNPVTIIPNQQKVEASIKQNPNIADIYAGGEKVNLQNFWEVWGLMEQKYYDAQSLDNQKRIYGAIKGMVDAAGDPYTLYMDPAESKEFEVSLSGELEGIGAELSVDNGHLIVVSPLKGSPAEKAGLKAQDIIYKIDGEISSEMSLYKAILKIRGKKGTRVTLTILRKDVASPMEIIITRAKIDVPSVTWEQKENNIAYININQFGENTETNFKKATNEILLNNSKGIILDLRNNGGGFLESAVNILSSFLPGKQKAVIIKKKNAKEDEILYTSQDAKLDDLPLVVLVNEGTASASEILAGAIQDYKRGTVIGQKTFGKGSIQEIDELEDNSSLRVTVAKWFTPLNRTIDHVGLMPDIVLEKAKDPSPSEAGKPQKDQELEKALEYLKEKINK